MENWTQTYSLGYPHSSMMYTVYSTHTIRDQKDLFGLAVGYECRRLGTIDRLANNDAFYAQIYSLANNDAF
jgi:hypothetical protein